MPSSMTAAQANYIPPVPVAVYGLTPTPDPSTVWLVRRDRVSIKVAPKSSGIPKGEQFYIEQPKDDEVAPVHRISRASIKTAPVPARGISHEPGKWGYP